ncbi:DUF1616 domain-containing protein (plasmid) [Halobaculum sp. CBA1158]|uniref:DUF1616 domain-containing protein n=1 Tax=Halobaculum sp. CBA1158 TaxID=2904243 RepID=UPI001F1730EC|nr:DUF1616 domain-containing protein [Halobaculum sp. CBA1158]UIP01456.1 DUF1616 domain-containing protein [Halobaculum sp. CBA1158]
MRSGDRRRQRDGDRVESILDLAAAATLTVVAVCAVVIPAVADTTLGLLVGVPTLLLVPGYALTAALFPATVGTRAAGVTPSHADWPRRLALSVGLSVGIVPAVSLALTATPYGVARVSVVVAVAVMTAVLLVVATARRLSLPPEARLRVPLDGMIPRTRPGVFDPESRLETVLAVALVAAVVVAAASVAFAATVPTWGGSYTEFSLLAVSDDGDAVAEGYPTEFTAGDPEELVVGVGNARDTAATYTVIVAIQRVDADGTVTEAERLRTFRPRVAAGDTWRRSHEVAPEMTGEDLRLVYLLYRGDPPAEPSIDSADRALHLWVSVASAEGN